MDINSRIRLNLSKVAKLTLTRDMIIFNVSPDYKEGTFINQIIELYIDGKFDIKNGDNYLKLKGDSKVYYLRDNIIDELESRNEKENRKIYNEMNHFSNFSDLIKTIVECYCRLPCLERERIILDKLIRKIEEAIKEKRKIHILSLGNPIKISPYKIAQGKESLYSYLIGLNEDGEFRPYRLTTITKIRKLQEPAKFNEDELLNIDEALEEYGPTFAFEEPTTIIVKFLNKKAETEYLYSQIHRPIHSEVIDKENLIYKFNCSLKQGIYFFFRFTNNIEIIEPIELKNKLKEMYKAGLEACS